MAGHVPEMHGRLSGRGGRLHKQRPGVGPASLVGSYFMKNHNRMMMGIGTPTSHRMIERMSSPLLQG